MDGTAYVAIFKTFDLEIVTLRKKKKKAKNSKKCFLKFGLLKICKICI